MKNEVALLVINNSIAAELLVLETFAYTLFV